MSTATTTAPEGQAARDASDAVKPDRRWYVTLSKRGKKVALTLNGGVLFRDPKLAYEVCLAAIKKDGWTRAVATELELVPIAPTDTAVEREWRVIGTMTITPPKKEKSHA